MELNSFIFNYNCYFLLGGLFLSYLLYRILHSLLCDNSFIQTKFRLRRHTWRSIQCNKSIPYNICCTVCCELMLPVVGLFCECCAVSACKQCYKVVNKTFRCKPVSWPADKPFKHHWVNIGVSQGENCSGEDGGIKRYFCTWCQRTKLSFENICNDADLCDFQRYKNVIIPPTCVQVEKGAVVNIKPMPDNHDWEPLIIFANPNSGSNRSDEVLSLFRGLLNPIQVVDLSTTTPESVVRWLPLRCRLLAAGGDGTVAWLLNALIAAPNIKASVAILPMGTGNDLSRVLGWGPTCASPLDAHAIITNVRLAQEQPLDRWKITIKPKRSRLRVRPDRVIYAYNYASIGVDAQVALDFHHARKQFLFRYANRTLNYLTYVFLGAGRALDDGGCGGLERRLRVRLDGAGPLPLPPLQALVALNIPSWGAGVDLWSMGNENEVQEQSINDGKLEIVGISSSFHIARLQCGLAEPYRFAQTSRIKIDLEGSCAMQVDGEPWMQRPATITIEPSGQSSMLRAPEVGHD